MARRKAAKYTISAEDKTKKAVRSATQGLMNIKNHIGGLMPVIGVASGAAGLGMLISRTAKAGDELDKMSKRIGVSVEELSALSYASKISGTDINVMEKSMRYLSDKMLEMKRGTGEAKQTFEELGLEVLDGEGKFKSLTGMLVEIANKISNVEDETLKAAYASDIFGARSGSQLVPLLRQGEKGIEALMECSRELGIAWSTEDASAAAVFTDAMTDLSGALTGVRNKIGMALIPELSSGATALAEYVAENRELIGVKAEEAVDKVAEALKGIADHKDDIIPVFTVISEASKLLMMSLTGWGMIYNIAKSGVKEDNKIERRTVKSHAAMGMYAGVGVMGHGVPNTRRLIEKEFSFDNNMFSPLPDSILVPAPEPKPKKKTPELSPYPYSGRATFYDLMAPKGVDVEQPKLGMFSEGKGLNWIDEGYEKVLKFNKGMIGASTDYHNELHSLTLRSRENMILLTTEGYETEKELLKLHFDDQYGMLDEHDGRRIMAQKVLDQELVKIDRDALDEMNSGWKSFANNMSYTLASMAQQADGSFGDIEGAFGRMLENMAWQMASKASVFGMFQLGAGMLGVANPLGAFVSFVLPSFASGSGRIYKPTPAIIGDDPGGPERVLNASQNRAWESMQNGGGGTQTVINVVLNMNGSSEGVSELDMHRVGELFNEAYELGLITRE